MYVSPAGLPFTAEADARRRQPSIVRLGVLLLLFDVYLTWARIERLSNPDPAAPPPGDSAFGRLVQQPIMFQYIFFRKSTSRAALSTSPRHPTADVPRTPHQSSSAAFRRWPSTCASGR